MNYLRNALIAKYNENGKSYNFDRDYSYFNKLYREIELNQKNWPLEISELLDMKNWNIENLKDDKGNIHLPKTCFLLELTSKGNLALDWYPEHEPISNAWLWMKDWIRWERDWPIDRQSLPFNRILMIRDFEQLYFPNHRKYSKSDEYLIRAIKDLIENVIYFSNRFVNLKIITDLFIEYNVDRSINNIKIRKVEEVEKEREQQQKQNWLNNTFNVGLGVDVTTFLNCFKRAGLKYSTTARILKNEYNTNISGERVKNLLIKLYEEHKEVYQRTLKTSPVTQNVVKHRNPGHSLDIKKENLEKLIWEMPISKIAKTYNVSDSAIIKRCKKFDLERPGRGFWAKKQAGKI